MTEDTVNTILYIFIIIYTNKNILQVGIMTVSLEQGVFSPVKSIPVHTET